MYTYSSLPTPVRFLPVAVIVFVLSIGILVAQLMIATAPTSSPAKSALVAVPPIAPPAEQQPVIPVTGVAVSALFTPEVRYWNDDIVRWAGEYQLDPNIVATVMQIESCGNPQAISGSGAQGLFQVMPFHFDPGESMLDPDTNAKRGMAYLASGLTMAGDQPNLAFAGYNGGLSQIGKLWSMWPTETRRYYYWGSGIYADVTASLDTSGRLSEWLAAGGTSLCTKAHAQLGLQ
jgi:soluble lytic murein transglycosylase-like protein